MTSVSEQLRRLAVPQAKLTNLKDDKRPSLLYDYSTAAMLDRDSYHAIGLNGIEELSQVDPAFQQLFYKDLFSDKAKNTERAVQTQEVNDKLDKKINQFLLYVSPYLPQRAAWKCIEWLLYRFHIASFNMDGLMKCVLPYHSTNIFIRFIQLLDVEHPTHKWHWLAGIQKEGVTLATSHLVIRCERDPTFVAFICQLVEEAQQLQQQVTSKWPMDVIVNVFTITMVGLIHNMKTLGKNKLRPILSALHKGVQSSDENMNASCLMILSQICSKVQLKGEILEELFKLLVHYHPRTLGSELVKMIILSCQTQEKLNHLSFKTLDFLYSNEDFYQLFTDLNESGRIDRFLQFLIEASIKFLYEGDNEMVKERSDQFVRFLKSVSLPSNLRTLSLKLMIDGFVDLAVDERKKFYEIVAPVLNSLQQRYPQEFDEILAPYYSGSNGDNVEALNTLFQMSVSSVKHRPLHGEDISVSLALMHKDNEIQIQALKQISTSLNMMSTNGSDDEMNKTSFIMDNIVSILSTQSSPRLVDEVCTFVEAHINVVVERLDLIADQLVKKILLHSNDAEWTLTIQNILKLLCNEEVYRYGVEHETDLMDITSLVYLAVIHYMFSSNMNKKFIQQLSTFDNNLLKSILSAASDSKKMEGNIIEAIRANNEDIKTYKRRLTNFITACSNTIESSSRSSPAIYCLIAAGIKIADDYKLRNPYLMETLANEVIGMLSSSPTACNSGKMLQLLTEINVVCSGLVLSKDVDHEVVNRVEERIFLFFCSQLGREEKNVQQAFIDCFKETCFTNVMNSTLFYSSLWFSDTLDDCQLPNEFIHLTIIHLLQQLLVAVSKSKELSNKYLSNQSHLRVFRLLLIAMTSQYKHIRQAAMGTLKIFKPIIKGNKGMVEFVELIITKHEEVETDDQQIIYLSQQFFTYPTTNKKLPAKLEARRKLLSGLVENKNGGFNRFMAYFVTRVLDKTHNPAILLELVKTSRELLDATRKENEEFPADQSNLLRYSISRMTPSLIGKNDEVKELFYDCLKINNPIANNMTQMESFALVASRDFYKELNDKRSILTIIFDVASSSGDIQVIQACRKAFKAITVDGELLEKELKSCCENIGKTTKSKTASATEGKTEDELKRLITLLDMVQVKKRITNSEKLIEPLFHLLGQIMKTSSWNFNFDCTCQLAMASLLNLFERFQKNNNDKKHLHATVERIVNVQLLVDYVRCCENVQTCQQAILLLASIASIYPEKVLHSVMSVFTFMGNNLLQRDDSFSFQIISQAIKTILPTILSVDDSNDNDVLTIISVFVDAFPDIPAHRRSMVFKELVETIGEEKYLSKLVFMLIDQTLTNRQQNNLNTSIRVDNGDTSDTSLETCINDWCSIFKLFDINSQLQAIVQLLAFIQQIPTTQDEVVKSCTNDVVKFDKKSDYFLRRYILVALTFSSNLLQTSKNTITRKLDQQDDGDDEEKQLILSTFERLVESILEYIHHISHTVVKSTDVTSTPVVDTSSFDRYHKALTHRLNELLTRTNSLLPTKKFLSVVNSLMKDGSEIFLLHRSVHLFNNRIPYLATSMSTHEMEAVVVGLSEQFFKVFTNACESSTSSSSDEMDSLIQSTAVALKHVFRICDRVILMKYEQFIPPLCCIINNNLHRPKVVMSALLIIGEMCVKLKARCIAHLPKICGCLANFFDRESAENLLALNIALQTTQKLFNTVTHFLGPYLKIFIPRLCMLASARRMSLQSDSGADQKAVEKRAKKLEQQGDVGEQITIRLRSLLLYIPTHIKLTSIMDSLSDCYDVINTSSSPTAISPLLYSTTILSARFNKENTSNYSARLFMFYIKALDFRGHHQELSLEDVDYVEKETLNGVLTLFLKLPEAAFRTLFQKLNQWAGSDSFLFSRTCSYYRCVCAIVDKLKILFTTCATTIVDHLQQVLTISLSTDTSGDQRREDEKFVGLKYAVETLRLSLLYCGKSFMDQKRTDQLLEPLVDQLEITSDNSTLSDDYVTNYVIPCIGEMSVSCADAVSWQPLNQHILSKAKHDDEKVRCRAPSAILHLVERLDEDYRIVLPELVPYFDEMNEDDSPMVVSHCRKIIQQLDEKYDQYFQKNIDD